MFRPRHPLSVNISKEAFSPLDICGIFFGILVVFLRHLRDDDVDVRLTVS